MREAFRDFFNKLFFRHEHRPLPKCIQWQTFAVFSPSNVESAIWDLKRNGWVIKGLSHEGTKTYILCYRERFQ